MLIEHLAAVGLPATAVPVLGGIEVGLALLVGFIYGMLAVERRIAVEIAFRDLLTENQNIHFQKQAKVMLLRKQRMRPLMMKLMVARLMQRQPRVKKPTQRQSAMR